MVLIVIRVATPPAILESVYGRGVYRVVSVLLDACFERFPISFALLGLIALVAYAGYLLFRCLTRRDRVTLLSAARAVTRTLAVLAVLFLLCWGFNYGRPGIPGRLHAELARERALLSTEALVTEYARTADLVNGLRSRFSTDASYTTPLTPAKAKALGRLLRATLGDIGFPSVPLRPVRVLPKGALLRFGTAGVYSPWTGDPHIDGALHPLQQTFTAAHELAHQQGVTDEGDCNLLAYLAGVRSPDIRIRYSAELTYLRYLRAAISKRDRETFEGLSPKLAPRVLLDLREIRAAQDAYSEIAPAARDLIYDSYLKTQGVSEGLSSYGRIIDHVVAARTLRPELFAEGR